MVSVQFAKGVVMLSEAVVERLVSARGLRFGRPTVERRKHVRYPLRTSAHLRTLVSGKHSEPTLSEPTRVSVRDISLTGVGLVIPAALVLSNDWLLTIPSTRGDITLLCRTVRQARAGSTHLQIGAVIQRLLEGFTPTTGEPLPRSTCP